MFALCKRSQYEQLNDEMTTFGKGILVSYVFCDAKCDDC